MAQLKNPIPPVSKTVQRQLNRLLAQIQDEAEAATLAALSAKDGIVTLQPMPTERRRVEPCTATGFIVYGADGSELIYFIRHAELGDDKQVLVGPRWSVAMELLDGQGRSWRTSSYDLITDDFGTLVPVGGAA